MRNTTKFIIQETLALLLVFGSGSNAIAQQVAEQDPNLSLSYNHQSNRIIDNELTLYWINSPPAMGGVSNPLVPTVMLHQQLSNGNRHDENCDYLGFVDRMGSLLRCYKNNGDITGVYAYNGNANSLVRQYSSIDDIPVDVIKALRNKRYLYISQKDPTNPPKPDRANSNSPPTHYVAESQESDSNFPPSAGGDSFKQNGLPLQWTLTATQPGVAFTTREVANPNEVYLGRVEGLYLGFNRQGSWVASASNGKVYIWNFQNRTLTVGANSWWEVPLDLSNPSPLMQAIIYYDQHSQSGSGSSGQTEDPNFPPTLARNRRGEVPVSWGWGDPVSHQRADVLFTNTQTQTWYLGFNERGSWLQTQDHKIYIWSFKTMSLTEAAIEIQNVPVNVLTSLKNKSESTKGTIADLTGHGNDGAQVAVNSKGKTPYIPPSVAGDGNAQYSNNAKPTGISNPSNNSISPAGSATQLKGFGATVKNGVLTFTISDPGSPDNGKQVSYKVARSAMMMKNPNAPMPTGITGTWIADDPKNKDGIILFVMKDEGTVIGTVQSGMVAQAMKRMMTAPH